MPLFLKAFGELGDGRCLARSVDADDENDLRPSAFEGERFGDGRKALLHLFGNDAAQIFLGQFLVEPPRGEAIADARGHGGTKVGHDQRLLDLVERLVVERRLAEQPGQVLTQFFGCAL